MKLGVTLSTFAATETTNLVDRAVELGTEAERLGLDSMWFAQMASYDAIALASAVGRAVPRIFVGTAVVPIYPRHPQILASAKTAPGDYRWPVPTGHRARRKKYAPSIETATPLQAGDLVGDRSHTHAGKLAGRSLSTIPSSGRIG